MKVSGLIVVVVVVGFRCGSSSNGRFQVKHEGVRSKSSSGGSRF